MRITIGRAASALIAIGYVLMLIVQQGGLTADVLRVCTVLVFPLALIWFPEELGGLTGYFARGMYVDTETPPIFLSIMGWFFLVGLPALVWYLGRG